MLLNPSDYLSSFIHPFIQFRFFHFCPTQRTVLVMDTGDSPVCTVSCVLLAVWFVRWVPPACTLAYDKSSPTLIVHPPHDFGMQ